MTTIKNLDKMNQAASKRPGGVFNFNAHPESGRWKLEDNKRSEEARKRRKEFEDKSSLAAMARYISANDPRGWG